MAKQHTTETKGEKPKSFQETVRRLLETPPKPRVKAGKKEGGRSRPKLDRDKKA